MKKFLSLVIALAMILTTLSFPMHISAAGITPATQLVSVAYSDTLDLYVTIASDGQLYTSGDGLNWGKGAKLDASINLGNIVGNSYYVTPDAVIWNSDKKEFAVAAGDKLYRSTDGFTWGEPITPVAGSKTLVIHTLFWDGSKYWAATTTGGQVAYANDDTLTSWTAKGLASGTQRAIDGFAKSNSGRLFAVTSVNNAKTLYYTDDGTTWTDGTSSGTAPYRTTSVEYSPKLDKIILAGGNGSNNGSTQDAAIGRADVLSGLTEAKLQLKASGTYVQVPVISDFEIYTQYNPETNAVTKEEIISVSYTGAISYRNVGDASDLTKNRKWLAVEPASGVTANTTGLTAITHGKNGYVAVGGDPSNHDRTSLSGAVAIFIPDDYTLGYKVGTFDDNATPVAKSMIVKGADEIKIPATDSATASYTEVYRDIAGKEIADTLNTAVWSIKGGPIDGITIENGVVTVTSEAVQQRISIVATDSSDSSLVAQKEVLISAAAQPSSILVTGSSETVKSEVEDRTFSYTASVLDELGRDVPEIMGGVAWSVSFPEEGAATGVTIDAATGILTVSKDSTEGIVNVVATSTYPGFENVSQSFKVNVKAIASVTISGPTNYYHYFKQTTKTPCSYIFTASVKDSEGKVVSEQCEYSLSKTNNPGVTMSTALNGDCIITLNQNTISDAITLVATVKNAPEVKGTFELNIVDTMIPNGDLYEADWEGNVPMNWTNIGTLAPTNLDTSEHHGRWIFQITGAAAEDYVSYQSDMFGVTPGAVYKFGFRSAGVKIAEHDENFTPMLYMMVTLHDENGEMTGEPVLIFDSVINEGKAHSSSVDFYDTVTIPEGAVSAQVTMTATPPIEFNLYDIGCYPLVDSGSIEILGADVVHRGETVNLTANVTNLMYNDMAINTPDGVRWYLKESYQGVTIDRLTGALTISDKAKKGSFDVVAVVSGNSAIRAEKHIELDVKEFEITKLSVTEDIAAGGTVSANAKVNNTTDSAQDAILIVAVYSAQGKLEYCNFSESVTVNNDNIEVELSAFVTIPEEINTEGWFAKAFVWKSVGNVIPVK